MADEAAPKERQPRAAKTDRKPAADRTDDRKRRSRQGLVKAPLKVGYDVGAILLELFRIPVGLWLRAAEVAGRGVLAAWHAVWPALVALARLGRRVLVVAERVVTPRRAAIFVALAAIAALVASQFVDYRAVEIGAPDYRGVTAVAPPPAVDPADPRSAHGLWMIVIAAVAFAIVLLVAAGRGKRLGRLLVPLGAGVILIALVVDQPHGLETGQAGIAYEGARAVLRDGFGAEIAAGAVLALSGVLLALYAPATEAKRSRPRARLGRRTGSRSKPESRRARPARPGDRGSLRPGGPRKANG
jgi:hypothetical protein